MKNSEYCNLSNAQRRRFHALGGVKPKSPKELREEFKKNFHTCPSRYCAMIQRKRRYAPKYQTPWKLKDDDRLVKFIKRGKSSLLSVCKLLGRNPNGVVLRTIELGIEPIFKGKEYRGRFYQDKFDNHYGV